MESYRKLSKVPEPVKNTFRLEELFSRIRLLYTSLEKNEDAIFDISDYEKDALLVADQNLISQVLLNLLKNALEATEKSVGARIVLRAVVNDGYATEI